MLDSLKQRVEFFRYHLVHQQNANSIRRWQEQHLKSIVRNAARNVPLWQNLLASAGIDPKHVSLETLDTLPTTNKSTYTGRMFEEYIDNTHPITAGWNTTSGTSGQPFTFVGSDTMTIPYYIDFASLRFLTWRGMRARNLSKVRMARIKIRARSSARRLFIPVADFQKDPPAVIHTLAQFQPEVLSSYPSVLIDLVAAVEQGLADPLAVPYVLSFGEMLSSAARERIERVLQTEVYDRYGIEETGPIGVECAKHDGFHVNAESYLLEVVDEAMKQLPDGSYGRILVTDLLNYNMPFIRYDTGDHGVIRWERCACGLECPRIWIEGRYSASLFLNGRNIHHLEFDGVLDDQMNVIVQYQIAKVSERSVEARIIPGPAFNDRSARLIKAKIAGLVGDHVATSVHTMQSLPRMPRGKSRIVVDESAPNE